MAREKERRTRAEWILTLPGFWHAVWGAEDRLAIPRRRDLSAHQPLPSSFAPWMRERLRRRHSTPELFAEGGPSERFSSPDAIAALVDRMAGRYEHDDRGMVSRDVLSEATDAVYAVLDCARWHETLGLWPWALYREAQTIIARFGLEPADDGFVASCVYDSIEYHVGDNEAAHLSPLPVIHFDERDLKILSASKAGLWTHHFEVGRIYVDVTDAVDPAKEIEAVLPIIERYRARSGKGSARRPGPGNPPHATHAAYAELLRYEPPGRKWKQVAQMVNERCGTEYDASSLTQLVKREADRRRRTGAA